MDSTGARCLTGAGGVTVTTERVQPRGYSLHGDLPLITIHYLSRLVESASQENTTSAPIHCVLP